MGRFYESILLNLLKAMRFNISCPPNGTNKMIEITNMKILNKLFGLRISNELDGDILGEEYAGYIFKISGGNDKQGFTMKQGVLTNTRVRLLLSKGHSCYRPRRKGERKRKSVRGCTVGPDIAVLALIIIKVGEKEIHGLTDKSLPNRLGPKRVSKIRRLFNLTKNDNPCDFVITRIVEREKDGLIKKRYKRPKIQRLVTRQRLRQKTKWLNEKKKRISRKKLERDAYQKMRTERSSL